MPTSWPDVTVPANSCANTHSMLLFLFGFPMKSYKQNDHVYVQSAVKEREVAGDRLLHKSVVVNVAVSTLGCSDIHFLELGVKINGEYYRNTVLRKMLLPDIRHVSEDLYTFQQDSAPAHRPRTTVEMLKTETPDFIPPDLWPPNSPDLNPVDYSIWSILQEKV